MPLVPPPPFLKLSKKPGPFAAPPALFLGYVFDVFRAACFGKTPEPELFARETPDAEEPLLLPLNFLFPPRPLPRLL